MQHIVKFGLTKASKSSTLQAVVIYGPWSLGGIGIFDPLVIQRAIQISFIIKHYYKLTSYSLLLWANLSTIQLGVGRGGCILENNYIETQQWLQTDYWIH